MLGCKTDRQGDKQIFKTATKRNKNSIFRNEIVHMYQTTQKYGTQRSQKTKLTKHEARVKKHRKNYLKTKENFLRKTKPLLFDTSASNQRDSISSKKLNQKSSNFASHYSKYIRTQTKLLMDSPKSRVSKLSYGAQSYRIKNSTGVKNASLNLFSVNEDTSQEKLKSARRKGHGSDFSLMTELKRRKTGNLKNLSLGTFKQSSSNRRSKKMNSSGMIQ